MLRCRAPSVEMPSPTLARAARAVRLGSVPLLAATAAVHALRAARGDGSVARHLAFVAVDLAVAVLVGVRPRWALAPVALLFAQQLTSHGHDLVRSLAGPGPADLESLGVLAFFAALLSALAFERTRSRSEPRRGAPPGP